MSGCKPPPAQARPRKSSVNNSCLYTMEQAVAGEKGAEYVREWAKNDGGTWQPPDRIKDIVDVLGHIDDDTLETVRTMVVPLMAKRGGISSDVKTA